MNWQSLLLDNIGELVTNDPRHHEGPSATSDLGIRGDAALVIEGQSIAWVGRSACAPPSDQRIDCQGRAVLPGFVDSHSHLIFAGDRAAQFEARMSGQAYSAGGIATTVTATRAASDSALRANAARLVAEMSRSGTTTFEIKSGYGLTTADEARALVIAAEFTSEVTYLGAHVVPLEFSNDPGGYVDLVSGSMMDACAPVAKWIDVFCDSGAFDASQARAILQAGIARGLVPRVHANQLQPGPGVALAVELGAASADHCTHLSAADVDALAQAAPILGDEPGSNSRPGTVATLLPAAEFSTRSPYPQAGGLLERGVMVALATDCNPGSSYTTSMPFCIAVAVRDMGMTPAQAVWAATRGGAAALRRDDVGRLVVGARADVVLLDAPTHVHLAYRPGVDLIDSLWRSGRRISGRGVAS